MAYFEKSFAYHQLKEILTIITGFFTYFAKSSYFDFQGPTSTVTFLHYFGLLRHLLCITAIWRKTYNGAVHPQSNNVEIIARNCGSMIRVPQANVIAEKSPVIRLAPQKQEQDRESH